MGKRITITFEDKGDGKVRVEVNPSVEKLMRDAQTDKELSPAQSYAFAALSGVRQLNTVQKQAMTESKLILPGRPGGH